MHQTEAADDVPMGEFPLPVACWLHHYGRPLQVGFAGFSEWHSGDAMARQIIDAEEAGIALYQRYGYFVSDGFLHRAQDR